MSSFIIKDTLSITKSKWADFAFNHPNGNIFQTPEMYEIYKNTINYEPEFLAVVNENDEILATLLAVIQKEHKGLFGKFSARSIIIGGPIIKDNDENVLEFLLNEYDKKIKGKVIYTQIRNLFNQLNFLNVYEKLSYKYESHLNILIDLTQDKEILLNNIQRNKRRNVIKAINKGIRFIEIKDKTKLEISLGLIRKTYSRVKLPVPDTTLFTSAYTELYQKGMLKIFGAFDNHQIIGVRLLLIFNNLIYDWFAGSDDNFKNRYPNDFLIYYILMWGYENNYHIFDFGGAGKPEIPYGVRDYKMKFGGDLVEFGRYLKVDKPLIMQLGKYAINLYKYI